MAAAGVTPQEPTNERRNECADQIDYVAGIYGEGCYPHCWRYWCSDHLGEHQEHEARLPYVTRVTLAGRTGVLSAEHSDYAGVKLAVQDDGRTLKVLPLADDVYKTSTAPSVKPDSGSVSEGPDIGTVQVAEAKLPEVIKLADIRWQHRERSTETIDPRRHADSVAQVVAEHLQGGGQ